MTKRAAARTRYRLLVARTVVDEMFYNEGASEVVLIKYTG